MAIGPHAAAGERQVRLSAVQLSEQREPRMTNEPRGSATGEPPVLLPALECRPDVREDCVRRRRGRVVEPEDEHGVRSAIVENVIASRAGGCPTWKVERRNLPGWTNT